MGYGANNPYDDFATMFELYFTHLDGNQFYNDVSFVNTESVIARLGDKWDLVSDYIESI